MSARLTLRTATRAEHDRVDTQFSAHDLASRDGYARFLATQAGAHLPVERAVEAAGAAELLADWPLRRRADALLADLGELGVAPVAEQNFELFRGEASLLGAIYVLEGSRLGGAVLRRQISAGLPARFLSPGAPGAWRMLTDLLDERLRPPAALDEAIASARAVFACFEAAGSRPPES
ncbi:biliverdin-producing heme oxygenase [Sphingoaurantiacus capsulatus]|uniref:Biliverdin-producing heme oxygenase n=1 Tax=Sphingoaurantiacus capsulatus TaxID=1771310 RepID=A0ABV7XAQ0_9SPHN